MKELFELQTRIVTKTFAGLSDALLQLLGDYIKHLKKRSLFDDNCAEHLKSNELHSAK